MCSLRCVVAAALTCCFVVGSIGAQSPAFPIGLEINTRPANAGGAAVPLRPLLVKVAQEDTLPKLLQGQGIKLDNETYSLLYVLNPGVDLAKLTPGTELRIPSIADPRVAAEIRNSKAYLTLDLNPDAKRTMVAKVESFKKTLPTFAELSDKAFASPEQAMQLKTSAADSGTFLSDFEAVIRHRQAAMNPYTVALVASEADALTQALDRTVKSKKLAGDDADAIVAINGDLKRVMKSIKITAGGQAVPPPQDQVVVEVRALIVDTPQTGYEVFFRGKYETTPRRFNRVTADAIQPMVELTYVFWAESPTTKKRTVTRELSVRVQNAGARQIIDLPIP